MTTLKQFKDCMSAEISASSDIVRHLYGALPDWVSPSARSSIEQAVTTLRVALIDALRHEHRKAELSERTVNDRLCKRIVRLVARAGLDDPIPGAVRDVTAFIEAVDYLAYVRRFLQLAKAGGKARALEELGGPLAAKTYRDLRRGKETQAANLHQRNEKLRAEAKALRAQNPRLTTNAIAKRLSAASGLSTKHVTRIIGR